MEGQFGVHCDLSRLCIKSRLHYGNCGREQYLSSGRNYFKWIQHTTCIQATTFLVSAWFIVTDSANTFSLNIFYNCFHFHVSTKYIIILCWSSIDHVRSCRSEADFKCTSGWDRSGACIMLRHGHRVVLHTCIQIGKSFSSGQLSGLKDCCCQYFDIT